jgi:hypothetical protein
MGGALMSDPLVSGGFPLSDNWSNPIWLPGLQKLDVCTYNGAARCQFHTVATNEWTPGAGLLLDSTLFRSLPALDEVFARLGGVDGVRFISAVVGQTASVTFHAFMP